MPQHGGDIIAEVLARHGVTHLFTLCGGHISPILTGAQARGIKNYVSPGEVVERVGVKASDVPLCLISHLHYDHWAGHTLFPKAQFWIQKDEVAFWTGRYAGTPAFRRAA